jgi:hypothetical protein
MTVLGQNIIPKVAELSKLGLNTGVLEIDVFLVTRGTTHYS